jgi:hypothetical protein
MNKHSRGQSLIDLIFSVGIIVLVLSGVVVLMVSSISTKTKGFDRKTASRMAELVMERMVSVKESDPVGFFGPSYTYATASDQTLPEFPGYSYSIIFSDYRCLLNPCVMVAVTAKWTDKAPQTFVLNRVFVKI